MGNSKESLRQKGSRLSIFTRALIAYRKEHPGQAGSLTEGIGRFEPIIFDPEARRELEKQRMLEADRQRENSFRRALKDAVRIK